MNRQIYLFIFVFWNLVSACGGAAGDINIASPSNTAGGSVLALDGITEFSLESDGARLSTEEINPEDTYIVALYTTNQETQSVYAYGLGASSSSSPSSSQALIAGTEDFTEDFHGALRSQEENLNPEDSLKPQSLKFLAAQSETALGSGRSFKVITDARGSRFVTVQATLRYVSADFLVYVDDRNAQAFLDSDLEEVLTPFAAHVADERVLFGDESDVNGDGRFAVLLSQAVNELGENGGGMLTGFFYAADLHDSDRYPLSNEMDLIYGMVPDPAGEFGTPVSKKFTLSNVLPSVLPHELQHLINYNQRVLVGKKMPENAFLNEGLSHLAEDIYNFENGYMTKAGIENPARVAEYLSAIQTTCFTCGTSLKQRGGIYLFLRYLYEQAEAGRLTGAANGAELIDRMIHSPKTGVPNLLEAALGDSSPSRFKELMGPFSMAVYLSDTGFISDDRYAFKGISLRSLQKDRRGTVLSGPNVLKASSLPYQGTISASAFSYVQVTGEELIGSGSDTLPLTVAQGMEGGGYLIRLNAE